EIGNRFLAPPGRAGLAPRAVDRVGSTEGEPPDAAPHPAEAPRQMPDPAGELAQAVRPDWVAQQDREVLVVAVDEQQAQAGAGQRAVESVEEGGSELVAEVAELDDDVRPQVGRVLDRGHPPARVGVPVAGEGYPGRRGEGIRY